jgi:hypothetical protein
MNTQLEKVSIFLLVKHSALHIQIDLGLGGTEPGRFRLSHGVSGWALMPGYQVLTSRATGQQNLTMPDVKRLQVFLRIWSN